MNQLMNEWINNFLSSIPESDDADFKKEVIKDLWVSLISREASLLGRKEVLTGKAKFGILGDGKEVPQVAMARFFKEGDWRSGYYRDQTLMFALGLSTVEDFFAQLYADAEHDPFSGGRQMNAHFATRTIDDNGNWLALKSLKNISPDVSPTAGQMARGLGIALASAKYRNISQIAKDNQFSNNGSEISFVTIGDASTSEGAFWETINCAAVNKAPMCVVVWDDGYGISVPKDQQTVKASISQALSGFETEGDDNGIIIKRVKAYDYAALCQVFEEVTQYMRTEHRPALIHVTDVTQPQGHSTSGSHERYKSAERLAWEEEYDCITKMQAWMVKNDIIDVAALEELNKEAVRYTREAKKRAWKNYADQITAVKQDIMAQLNSLPEKFKAAGNATAQEISSLLNPSIGEVVAVARNFLMQYSRAEHAELQTFVSYLDQLVAAQRAKYHDHLYSDSPKAALKVPVVHADYGAEIKQLNGYQILNQFFDAKLEEYPELIAFGEDVGQIGDVNQGFAGLQEKHGEEKVFDTGIQEWSIMGMAIGTAARGLRPIAEIQYLDYLLYGLAPLSDDLATYRYRSNGQAQAPAIIRTRGHRLEGIWHSGSPMGMIINALRGMYILVPRNMTQAAGFYNTMLQSDDPALIIECLNGYRLKEDVPVNLASYTVPLGVPEILVEGDDVTLVTYGSCVRVAQEAVDKLAKAGIQVELIDVQSLLPFDLEGVILESLKKTNKIVFLDEDFPGGATAYMLQKVMEEQGGYRYLDARPMTITAHEHRPPFGSNGDYFTKPNPEDVYEKIYKLMHAYHPQKFN